MRKLRPSAFATTTWALSAVLWSAAAVTAAPPSPVRTAPVTLETVQEHRRVTGSLRAVARTALASQEPGQIAAVLVDEGMPARAGQLIARIDDRRLQAQVLEAEATLERARAALTEAQAEAEFARYERGRVHNLYQSNTASEREYQEAVRLAAVAEARTESARRAETQAQRVLELLRIRLGDTRVVAPFDAIVVRRHVDVGEWVEAGQPIVELASIGTIEARLEVPERLAEAVAAHADEIYVEVAGLGKTQPSQEVRVIRDVDPRARTFSVIVTLDNRDGLLAPGMSVNAWLPTTERREYLTAPKSAVIRHARDAYVYRAADDDSEQAVAQQTPVAVLFSWQDRLVVQSEDLAPGDLVVVEGNERLLPGSAVTFGTTRR